MIADLTEADIDALARKLNAAWGPFGARIATPGMLLTCSDRVWRVTHARQEPPFPGDWIPVLTDDATGGILLAGLADEVRCVLAGRVSLEVPVAGTPGAFDEVIAWEVVARGHRAAHRATSPALGVAVADVLLALGGGL